jgi:arsenical-resistance protein 2
MIPGAINLPAHTIRASLPLLVPLLAEKDLVLFHCSSSRGRGPRAAGWWADALEEYLNAKIKIRHPSSNEQAKLEAKARYIGEHVGVLTGGIKAWEAEFGARPVEERGQKMEARRPNGRLDLRTIPL